MRLPLLLWLLSLFPVLPALERIDDERAKTLVPAAEVEPPVERIDPEKAETYVPKAEADSEGQRIVHPDIAELTVAQWHELAWPHVHGRWGSTPDPESGQPGPPMIGEILDMARRADIDYLRTRRLEPALSWRADDDARLARLDPAARQAERDRRYKACVDAMLATWDGDGDGELTLAEIGDFAYEVIPLTYKFGTASSRTVVQRFLVARRYCDFDGDGQLNSIEWEIFDRVRSDLGVCRGDFSKKLRRWSEWVAKAKRARPAGE